MKAKGILGIVCIALTCVLLSSCTDEDPNSQYASSIWFGQYAVQMQNNDTGEFENYTATVTLDFNDDATECAVTTGIKGLYAANRKTYSVKWYSGKNFTLYETQGGQTTQYYSGTIVSNDTMSFEFLSCDKVERTVELRMTERAKRID